MSFIILTHMGLEIISQTHRGQKREDGGKSGTVALRGSLAGIH